MLRTRHRGDTVRAAAGDAWERTGCLERRAEAGRARVWVGRSPRPAERQAAGREQRLAPAETPRAARTPARGRGQRQSTEDAQRVGALAPVRPEPRVEGWLRLAWAQPLERHTR